MVFGVSATGIGMVAEAYVSWQNAMMAVYFKQID
jgi:hypothetical protein